MGSIRIGQSLRFREDMYSLLFVAFIRKEYFDACTSKQVETQEIAYESINSFQSDSSQE